MQPLPKEKLLEMLAELSATDATATPRVQVQIEQYIMLIEEVLDLRDKVDRVSSLAAAISMLGKKLNTVVTSQQ